MGKPRKTKRLGGLPRHGAPLPGDDGGGKGTGIAADHVTDAGRYSVAQREKNAFTGGPCGLVVVRLVPALKARRAEKEPDGADTAEIA